jgi:hypothetical protein
LHQIRGIRILQAALAGETVDQGSVQADELLPRAGIIAVT